MRAGENEEVVDCGTCLACCHQTVVLKSDEGDGLLWIDIGSMRVLRRRPDGSCVHLVDGRCSVRVNRPEACRVFHCGKWFLKASHRDVVELRRSADPEHRRMADEGRKRARALRQGR